MAEFDYSNTILMLRPIGPDATASLRSHHNDNRLILHFEDTVSRVSGYDDASSRECTPIVSCPPELVLHLRFDPEPKDATKASSSGPTRDATSSCWKTQT